ncbi:uncharacterized protein ACA1_357040, partial [Acanthamoeba castellanii str. Neff]
WPQGSQYLPVTVHAQSGHVPHRLRWQCVCVECVECVVLVVCALCVCRTPLPGWSRTPVLKAGQVAFHVLLWTAYSSIGCTALVLRYLLRQTCETRGSWLCTRAIRLGSVGYDYAGTKQLLSKTKLTRIVKVP